MVDITHKSYTLRKAIATAVVTTSLPETIRAIQERKVPKGDIFEFSRASALLAIKKTSDVIPDCHPLPVEFAAISYEIQDLSIVISVEVHTIYKTGVEVEAMHGASVAALVMYDMLKPIDKHVVIEKIALQEKHGGKSDQKDKPALNLKCAVIVCSDRISRGERQDTSGRTIIVGLEKHQLSCAKYDVIPDDFQIIQDTVKSLCAEKYDLLIFTGGTGLSPRDVTPEAVEPLIDRPIPGIMEAARSYGQLRTPYAMLSRGLAGFVKNMLVITLPGSQKAAQESMDALFPQVLHVFTVKSGDTHGS